MVPKFERVLRNVSKQLRSKPALSLPLWSDSSAAWRTTTPAAAARIRRLIPALSAGRHLLLQQQQFERALTQQWYTSKQPAIACGAVVCLIA